MTRLKRTKTGKGTVSSSCCRGAEDHEHRTTQVGRDQTDLSSFEYLKGQSFHNTSYNLFHPHGKINLPSTQAEFPVLQLLPCSWCTCHKSGSICSKGSPLPVGEAGRSPFTLLLLRLNTPDSLHLSWCAMCSFPFWKCFLKWEKGRLGEGTARTRGNRISTNSYSTTSNRGNSERTWKTPSTDPRRDLRGVFMYFSYIYIVRARKQNTGSSAFSF